MRLVEPPTPRLLGIDLETTGLDTGNDRVTEIGLVLWDTATKRPLATHSLFLWDEGIKGRMNPETVAMMERLCGISQGMLEEFGIPPQAAFAFVASFCDKHKVDYLVAHNAENFDRPMLLAELSRHGIIAPRLRELPWLDTRTDLPFSEEPSSRRLVHLAAEHGFVNPFAHRAVFDVLTMLRVLSHYDINEVIAESKIPFATIRAMVSYEDRQLAKDRRFSWEKIGEKTYPKSWIKRVKENKLDAEKLACKFPIVRLE